MNNIKKINARYETVAWGVMLIWLSVLMLIPGDQNNLFILGIGIILLGLNLVRSIRQIPVNWFSTTVGGLSLAAGALSLLFPMLGINAHLELDLFPILILVFGLYLLVPGPKKISNTEQ
jgi:hypothetical protein